jgi:hypothetical protein
VKARGKQIKKACRVGKPSDLSLIIKIKTISCQSCGCHDDADDECFG